LCEKIIAYRGSISVKEIKAYKCEICHAVFTKKEKAIDCEKNHANIKNLKVVDTNFSLNDSEDRFPEKILIEDKSYSGTLAEYKLNYIASVEDFEGWSNN
jgi:hypothetical protein